jgi:hypothetical protein
MMLGVTVTSIVAGQVTTKTGRYKVFPILGGGIMSLGLYRLTGLGVGTSRLTSALSTTWSSASAWASSCRWSR